jgi:hypothetical protein
VTRRAWLIGVSVVSGLIVLWAVIAFWPTSSQPAVSTLSPSTSPAPVVGFYKVVPDLCAATDLTGGVADHSEKSNYVLSTCERDGMTVSALVFTSPEAAAAHFKDVQANVTGAHPVTGVGSEAFGAGSSLWVHDHNLVLMVRFKTGGSAEVAADLARKSLPRLRS